MTSEDFLDSDEPGFTSGLATTFGYEGNFGAATHRIDVDRSQVVGLIGPMNISPYIEWTSEHLTYLFDARVKENRSLEMRASKHLCHVYTPMTMGRELFKRWLS